ncbi:MAG: DUF1292 domain-containing protein [Clostridia bacterium]|nr:DUF1292 domain-containing protein [Clostridia bacterium]NLF19774.1 DUF1292 domain-containing protein [Clostridiaceae bacterium]
MSDDQKQNDNIIDLTEHVHDENCNHEHHHHGEEDLDLEGILPDDIEEYTITMADEETGEEYTFYLADDFEMDGEVYCVLLSVDDDPEAIFAKVITMEDGNDGFETLEDDEFERVADFYEELCAKEEEEDEDDEDEDEEEEEDAE